MNRPRFIDQESAADGGEEAWQLVMPDSIWTQLTGHLFPGDLDEHGAVAAAGIVRTNRGTRLLVRELFIARDGDDTRSTATPTKTSNTAANAPPGTRTNASPPTKTCSQACAAP